MKKVMYVLGVMMMFVAVSQIDAQRRHERELQQSIIVVADDGGVHAIDDAVVTLDVDGVAPKATNSIGLVKFKVPESVESAVVEVEAEGYQIASVVLEFDGVHHPPGNGFYIYLTPDNDDLTPDNDD